MLILKNLSKNQLLVVLEEESDDEEEKEKNENIELIFKFDLYFIKKSLFISNEIWIIFSFNYNKIQLYFSSFIINNIII